MNEQIPVSAETCGVPGGPGCPPATPSPTSGAYSPIPSPDQLTCEPAPTQQPSTGCVGRDAMVTLESGEQIPASELTHLQKVLGFDANGQTRVQTVLAMSCHAAPGVSVETSHGKLVCSHTHSLFLESGEVTVAGLLTQGAMILTSDGSPTEVLNLENLGSTEVISITCEPDHTFIVDGLRSHNVKPSVPAEVLYL